jgi:hypothetical protein
MSAAEDGVHMFTSLKTRAASALMAAALAGAFVPAAFADPVPLSLPGMPVPTAQPGYQDLRPPDTRDAAEGYHPTLASQPKPVQASGGGFDWLSAAIGAAAGTGLMIVALALASTGRRHRVLRA